MPIDTLLAQAAAFIPLIATALAVFVVLYVANWGLLVRHPEFGNERRLPRQLLMLGLTVVGAVAVALALPVSESTRNQVIALIGVLLSGVVAFSSTTIISNLMAGLMLHVTKSFRTGDFIRVGEHFGRVAERGLFDTEIQTEQRELVSLSNTYLVAHPVTVVRSSGTIISATLSLGYDVHHARVQALLTAAAREAGLADPFVQIIELGDHAISYRVSGLLTEIKSMISARSHLYRALLDSLHGDGVEIVSPSFMNQRRLADDARILPQPGMAAVPAAESRPEEIVFDKAEQAEQREKIRHDLESEIARLEAQLKECEGETRQGIAAEIDRKRLQLAEFVDQAGDAQAAA